MSDAILKLTRDDIARMLKTTDQRLIKQMELVLKAANLIAGNNITLTVGPNSITIATNDTIDTTTVKASLTNKSGNLMTSSVAFTNGAGASAGTLLNAPAVGNPTKWLKVDDNGTTRWVPSW